MDIKIKDITLGGYNISIYKSDTIPEKLYHETTDHLLGEPIEIPTCAPEVKICFIAKIENEAIGFAYCNIYNEGTHLEAGSLGAGVKNEYCGIGIYSELYNVRKNFIEEVYSCTIINAYAKNKITMKKFLSDGFFENGNGIDYSNISGITMYPRLSKIVTENCKSKKIIRY
jgi:hypothetical protein